MRLGGKGEEWERREGGDEHLYVSGRPTRQENVLSKDEQAAAFYDVSSTTRAQSTMRPLPVGQ